MTEFTLTVGGAIPAGVGPNARGHYYTLGRVKREWRELWYHTARSAFARPSIANPFEHVRLEVRAYVCRSKARDPRALMARADTQRPTDGDNLLGCMKSAIDGIVSAGLVPDDTVEYVTHESPRIIEVDSWAEERIEIKVTV